MLPRSSVLDDNLHNPMISPDRRRHPRLRQNFQVQLLKEGADFSLEGTSVNLSQGGAFIKVKNWQSFQVQDRAIVTFFLPPEYTGQDMTVTLQGGAVIRRVDQEKEGIGIEFIISFRQFERVQLAQAAANI